MVGIIDAVQQLAALFELAARAAAEDGGAQQDVLDLAHQAQGRHARHDRVDRPPAHLVARLGQGSGRQLSNKPPIVGTGPFQTVQWIEGNYVRMVANKHYWRVGSAAP